MVERNKAGAPKITVKDFDDPEARAMHDVDFDLSDSARALIRNGINIDDRTAVESALSDTAGYTHDPAVFARYVDEVNQDGAPQYGHGPNPAAGEVADPLPAAARAPSPPAGYRGPSAVLGRRGQHIYQLRANRGPPYKERPAGQRAESLTNRTV